MSVVRAFDIEADELLLKATKVWCMVVQDVNTKELWKFGPDQIKHGIDILMASDMIVAHNGVMYDVPVLERIYNISLPKCLDTLLVSRLIFPDKFFHPLGGNALEDWGKFLKRPKKEYYGGFSSFSQEMLDYCVGDVELLTAIYEWQKRNAFKYKQAIRLEHDVAKIICKQILNGFTLDVNKANGLSEELDRLSDKIRKDIDVLVPPVVTTSTKSIGWKTLDGYQFNTVSEAKAFGYQRNKLTQVTEEVTTSEPFNPGSGQQIAKAMKDLYGWEPSTFTESGKPKLDEEVLSEIDNDLAKMILQCRTISKRSDFVKSWIGFMHSDGKVHGSVITNGAPSGRMGHSEPNMAQIPKVKANKLKKPILGIEGGFGYECRDCWKPRDGWVLVGADASGLELRMLAHRMFEFDSGQYAKLVLEDDIHVVNQKSAGLSTREQAKTFIYGLVYGAGDAKIGKIVGGSASRGRQLRNRFEKAIPAYLKLKNKVLNKYKQDNKVLYGLDGRPLPVRSEHAALNTLLQSDGAVVMKQALVCFEQEASLLFAGRYAYCANVHDEFQIECDPEIAKDIGSLMVNSIGKAGEILKVNIRLDGEYKIGNSWAETH